MTNRYLLPGAALVCAAVPAEATVIPADAEVVSDWEVANCDPDITDEQEDLDAWPDPIIRCGGVAGRVIAESSGDGVQCVRYTTEYGYRETCWTNGDQATRGAKNGWEAKKGNSGAATPMLQLSPAQRQRLQEQTRPGIKVETLKPPIAPAPPGSDQEKN